MVSANRSTEFVDFARLGIDVAVARVAMLLNCVTRGLRRIRRARVCMCSGYKVCVLFVSSQWELTRILFDTCESVTMCACVISDTRLARHSLAPQIASSLWLALTTLLLDTFLLYFCHSWLL